LSTDPGTRSTTNNPGHARSPATGECPDLLTSRARTENRKSTFPALARPARGRALVSAVRRGIGWFGQDPPLHSAHSREGGNPGRRASGQAVVEIAPGRVQPFDQSKLPAPAPLLDLPLAHEGGLAGVMHLAPDQPGNAVGSGEARPEPGPMLVDASGKIVRMARIERPVRLAGENVDVEGHRSAAAAVRQSTASCSASRPGFPPSRE